jgi:hypothetical protein
MAHCGSISDPGVDSLDGGHRRGSSSNGTENLGNGRWRMSADEIRAWCYMDGFIEQLQGEGFKLRDEDIARLSPLDF